MEVPPLRIPFPYELGKEYMLSERLEFWDLPETIQWFHAHGYTLYQRDSEDPYDVYPVSSTNDELVEANYPYAYYDTFCWRSLTLPLRTSEFTGKILYAQDSEQRHVVIKLVLADSDEYRILRFLSEQGLEILREHCIVPVLDFLPAGAKFWLVVMPRWDGYIHVPEYKPVREHLKLMRSMLKGLTFLHRHNIIHRDINPKNMLVNHFADVSTMLQNDIRVNLSSQGCLSYVLCDFDISIMVPPHVKKEDFRLPYEQSWWGAYHPADTMQGEFDYNPFIYDVGTLGVLFCHEFQTLVNHLPMLAPLFDRMTTRNLQQRFTATEALRFFDDRYAEIPQWVLEQYNDSSAGYMNLAFDECDRWKHVPPEFAAKWSAYKEPPISIFTRILRYVYCTEWFPKQIIPWIRWFFYKLTTRSTYPCTGTHFAGLFNPTRL